MSMIFYNSLKNRGKRAFTLVELLVVISIIALLLAILMPSLQTARAQAQKVVCRSNMRQIGIALQAYIAEYNRFPNDVYRGDSKSPFYALDIVEGGVVPQLIKALRPYYYSGAGRKFYKEDGTPIPAPDGIMDVEKCPADKAKYKSYSMATSADRIHLGFSYPQKGDWVPTAYPQGPMENNWKPVYYSGRGVAPADVPIFFDSDFWYMNIDPVYSPNNPDRHYGPLCYGGEWFNFKRHRKEVNMYFLDGHATSCGTRDKNTAWNYLQWLHRYSNNGATRLPAPNEYKWGPYAK
ncbi:MAG: hypothetical protein A2Y13_05425 [Planctomycetes bacterium GWC2_45_44]|nr:MAG: hypothetical protein A2Y13_05425 [Planctomycetes bacterium GWC2_45_44]